MNIILHVWDKKRHAKKGGKPSKLSPKMAAETPKSKVGKKDDAWKCIHEQAFQELSLRWPPSCKSLFSDDATAADFKEREAEVIWAAVKLFPACTGDRPVYDYMDASASFEKVFGWPVKVGKELVNPWKSFIPTIVGKSIIVIRVTAPDGTLTMLRRSYGEPTPNPEPV